VGWESARRPVPFIDRHNPSINPAAFPPTVTEELPTPERSVANEPLNDPRKSATAGLELVSRVIFIVLAMLAFAHFARAVVVPMLLAWVLSMALKPLVRWLNRCHVPLPVASALVVASLVVGAGLGGVYMVRPAVEWLDSAPDNLPRLTEKFRYVLRPAARLSEAATRVGNLAADDGAPRMPTVELKDHRVANSFFSWTGSLVASAGEAIALLFLLLASGDLFLQKLVRAIPRLRTRKQAIGISRDIHQTVSTYLFSMGLINGCFGVAVGMVLHWIGMPNALMWGGVAALLNFIPYIGPIVGMGLIGIGGLIAFETLEAGLMPMGAYLVLQLVEANAVTPLLLGRRFALNPVVIFISLIACASIWGPVGALLAVPLLITLKVVGDRIPSLGSLAELLAPHAVTEVPALSGTGATVVPALTTSNESSTHAGNAAASK